MTEGSEDKAISDLAAWATSAPHRFVAASFGTAVLIVGGIPLAFFLSLLVLSIVFNAIHYLLFGSFA